MLSRSPAVDEVVRARPTVVFGVSRGRIKPPKQILLSYAVKTLTNNVELVSILNRYGRSPSNGTSISHTSPWSQPFPE